ncbi:MAG: dTDP-4-dehydrorhamnose reductase [Hellea sp.]|nr:dTDP-4-dehydrorhamnose reductase [Hellea sp.]
MSLKFAVVGKTGQLARALQKEFAQSENKAIFYDREECDLSQNKSKIAEFMLTLPPVDAVILAAAYTAVDNAETDMQTAYAVNYVAPGEIAKACAVRNIPLVHISTDYVFNGAGTSPYTVDQDTDPVNVYGKSKRNGELAVIATDCDAAILRTSWVFDGSGKNFLTTMMRLSETCDILNVVGDQVGRPTYARHLAQASIAAAKGLLTNAEACRGIFHVSNSGNITSWAKFAEAIFAASNKDITVNAISSSDYPTSAARPMYSVMDISLFEETFDFILPSWQEGISAALAEH